LDRGRGVISNWLSVVSAIAGEGVIVSRYVAVVSREAEEGRFWETHDSGDYIDWRKAEQLRFPNLKASTTAISLRLPVTLLERIKIAANKRDVPISL
jgi:hypothetical protein